MPGSMSHNWEGVPKIQTFLQGVKGLCPTSGTLTPGSNTRKMSPPNAWFWKSIGIKSRGAIELWGMENTLLKSSRENSLALRSNAKATVWKVRETHLQILKQLLERGEPAVTFSGDGNTVMHHFCNLILTCLWWCWWVPLLVPSL